MARLWGRFYGAIWRWLWGDSVRYARERLEIEVKCDLLRRGLTATSPKHVWYDGSRFLLVEGTAPPDEERPYFLRGLALDICTAKARGTLVKGRFHVHGH